MSEPPKIGTGVPVWASDCCEACWHMWALHDHCGCHVRVGPSLDPWLCPCMHSQPDLQA